MSFYPQKERTSCMLALNNLLASPPLRGLARGRADRYRSAGFAAGDGRPPVTDRLYRPTSTTTERIFVTALLLNKLVTWMRTQPGTSELRALFYMDEIFGYFPPTANPPTKKPLLTLLKQARAYGVGVLLATQNPVDLDYKGLGNMGFWAIGRLQTTQDQARVQEGIEAALDDAGGDRLRLPDRRRTEARLPRFTISTGRRRSWSTPASPCPICADRSRAMRSGCSVRPLPVTWVRQPCRNQRRPKPRVRGWAVRARGLPRQRLRRRRCCLPP